MSPFKTFQSSGSSSNEVDLRKKPKRDNRWASDNKEPSTQALVMSRNFTKQKGFPCKPGHFCRKKIGLPKFTLTKMAKIKSNGDDIRSAKKITKKSKRRLFILHVSTQPLCLRTARSNTCSSCAASLSREKRFSASSRDFLPNLVSNVLSIKQALKVSADSCTF